MRIDDPPQNKAPKAEEEQNIPVFNIVGNKIPLYGERGSLSWALVNLILVIVGLLLAIATIIRVVARRKNKGEGRQMDIYPESHRASRIVPKSRNKQKKNVRFSCFAATVILAIIGGIVFLLTENMSFPMVLLDVWTIVNALILLAVLVFMVIVFKQTKHVNQRKERPRQIAVRA